MRRATAAGGVRAGFGCAFDRLIHDLADGAGATAALGAATEATVDLSGRAGTRLRLAGGADVLIAQNVAGADDHRDFSFPTWVRNTQPRRAGANGKRHFYM